MGKIEQIDELETYIEDLGNEIKKVKKASDYLKLLEKQQLEMEKLAETLKQSKDQLKDYRDVIESKFDLLQTTSRNIEARQQGLEQSLYSISTSIKELREHQENVQTENNTAFTDVKNTINENKIETIDELTRFTEEQRTLLNGIQKNNKIFFGVNVGLNLAIIGILSYIIF
ncbi:hypothetical protein [Bacillus sp. E(2018)]|uniref:hypothetical protein n=1 Tax=Bacillus sp. E(2018) TaxID=2502239 RepID=UPI0010F8470F|nr:hypothetical protein [Bacillus sp. E(2018)]